MLPESGQCTRTLALLCIVLDWIYGLALCREQASTDTLALTTWNVATSKRHGVWKLLVRMSDFVSEASCMELSSIQNSPGARGQPNRPSFVAQIDWNRGSWMEAFLFSKGNILKQFAEGQSVFFFLDTFCHIYSSGRQFIVKKSCHFCMLSQLTKAAEVLTK